MPKLSILGLFLPFIILNSATANNLVYMSFCLRVSLSIVEFLEVECVDQPVALYFIKIPILTCFFWGEWGVGGRMLERNILYSASLSL